MQCATECVFPAERLLAYRRLIVAMADRTNDEQKRRDIMRAVLGIDQLRTLHEDIDGCSCWLDAVIASHESAAVAR